MKKLMILACVAMSVACAANASTVKWSFTSAKVQGSSPANAVDFSVGSWTAYLVMADDWKDNKLDTLKTARLDESGVTVTSPSSMIQNASVAERTPTLTTEYGDYNMLMIITDGKQYLSYAGKDISVYDPEDPFATPTAFQKSFMGPTVATTDQLQSFASVPEPTSGLLLLLGVAGLALRRRRA